ncbi:MAG: sugar ABC transporter ATP-binding protein, partial [Thermodesulfovibrionales bacterium]|nr:sugar ABC transporter ATP-binding protein [Thermodesulfovibrionales bacterium]
MIDKTFLLQMQNIQKDFSGVKALEGVTLFVQEGTIHAICGENGAGKSTLMNILSGVYPYGTYSGEILINGKVSVFKDIKASEKAGISIIHQELSLVPELSITENIFLGNEVADKGIIDWTRAKKKAKTLMTQVGLDEDPDTLIKNIGVGKQQLVEIAKALSKDVKILILDEPTSALNEEDSGHLLNLLLDMRDKGITCILISHKLAEVLSVADSVTIIRDGKTIETIHRSDKDNFTEERIIRGMVGRPLHNRYPDMKASIGDVFFEVMDWTVAHPYLPNRTVCKGVSFYIRRGEIVGFAGLMGAGRTELALSLFGRSYGTYMKGKIIKDGKELILKDPREAINKGIAYVTEDRKNLGFNPLDDIKTTIVSAALERVSCRGVLD